ncbi:CHASE domain-containing protein [Azohydromonas aeria]|uniref:CHASE domain-containing protein n=1 Tax=Azohydromonas aeria TaxID=2590212 RepID=UPI0012F9C36C|nr:CHASE domain-containing protein [Azohydromonas aeria]
MRTIAPRRLAPWLLWPFSGLAAGLALAGLLASHQHRANETLAQERLQALAVRAGDRVLRRLRVYEYGLLGARSAVVAAGSQADEISVEQFRRFGAAQDFPRQYPGLTGFSFVRRVPPGQENAFLAQMQRDGWPQVQIHSTEPHAGDRFVVQYIEPIEGNAKALGYDVMSEPKRREAARAAIRDGTLTVSAPIQLVQSPTQTNRSVVLYLPVYRGIRTPEPPLRDAQAFGLVTAPLALQDVLFDFDDEDDAYALALTDVTRAQAPERIYVATQWQRDPSARVEQVVLPVYGRRWQLEVQASPAFVQRLNLRSPLAVALPATAACVLLASLLGAGLRARQRERLIVQERAQTAAVVDGSHDAIIRHTPAGEILAWNAAAERLLGWPAAEALGRGLLALIVPADQQDHARQVLARVQRGEDVPPFDTECVGRDGQLVPVSLSVSPIRSEEGGVIGVATTIRDMRLQRAAQAQLRRSEMQARHTAELFEQLIESSPDPIWTMDREGRWAIVNSAMAALLGRPRESLVGLRSSDVLPAAFAAQADPEDRRVLRDGLTLRVEQTLFDLSRGEPRFFLTIKAPLRAPDGRITGLVGLARDITERRAAEERLAEFNATLERRVRERTTELAAARDAADAASRAKSAFLAHMSHEFRTPLNAVIGLSQLLLQRQLPEDVVRFVGPIHQAGEQLLALTNDVLDLSRIEAGEMALESVAFDLPALLDAACALVRPQANQKRLALTLDAAAGLPARLVGDPLRLKQILINLLSNAVKFTPAGSVTLSARPLASQGARVLLRLDVADTGIGIAPEAQERIFEAFAQADASITRRFGGSGLGLSIVQRLVGMMDGELTLQSMPGKGSIFSVTVALELPVAAEQH